MDNGNHRSDSNLEASPGSSLDLDQLWYVVREKAWLIMLFGLLGILGGLATIALSAALVALLARRPSELRFDALVRAVAPKRS